MCYNKYSEREIKTFTKIHKKKEEKTMTNFNAEMARKNVEIYKAKVEADKKEKVNTFVNETLKAIEKKSLECGANFHNVSIYEMPHELHYLFACEMQNRGFKVEQKANCFAIKW